MISRKRLLLLGMVAGSFVTGSVIADGFDPTPNDPIVGRWRWHTGVGCVFKADGAVIMEKRKQTGKWVCVNPRSTPRKYIVNWNNGVNVDRFFLEKNATFLSGVGQKGDKIKEFRLPD